MENYPVNRSGRRPYNRTCGMGTASVSQKPAVCGSDSGNSASCRPASRSSVSMQPQARCTNNSVPTSSECPCSSSPKEAPMYDHLQHLIPAMAYVPIQQFTSAYNLDYALSVGTIFPQLCKPFCGKRGVRR